MDVAETPRRLRRYHKTRLGRIYLGDSLDLLKRHVDDGSVDLIMTSPPFGLARKKEYGNAADEYVDWFRPFGAEFRCTLKSGKSLVTADQRAVGCGRSP